METNGSRATAVFAGGCFWCIEHGFTKLEGVLSAVPGYIGGRIADPTYAQVAQGNSGHREAVLITYDPTVISYDELLDVFWRQIDPTDAHGQFGDRGSQYTTAIYYANEDERIRAEASKKAIEDSGRFSDPIVTKILPEDRFYIAESEHHGYAEKNALQYRIYAQGSGRAAFCKKVWK